MDTNDWLTCKPGSWREFLLAIVPFGLIALIVLLNALHLTLAEWVGVGLFGTLVLVPIVFLVGLLRGLPRWSLPYLGLLAGILNLVLFGSWFRFQFALPTPDSPIVQSIYSIGSPLVGLIVFIILFVLVVVNLESLRPLHNELSRDWTLLSLSLYGVMPLALFMAYDDHVNEEPYELAALLVSAAGAWIYLHKSQPLQKALTLLACITVVMALIIIGKWMIVPSQPWAGSLSASALEQTRWNAFSTTAVLWGWLVAIIIVIPALLSIFFRGDSSRPVERQARESA